MIKCKGQKSHCDPITQREPLFVYLRYFLLVLLSVCALSLDPWCVSLS